MSERQKKAKRELSIHAIAHRLFKRLAASMIKSTPDLKDRLLAANILIFPETYVSLMLFAIFLSLPLALVGIIFLFVYRSLLALTLLFIPSIIAVIFLYIPNMMASARAESVDYELPYAAAYITTMAMGGVSPIYSLQRLTKNPWLQAMAKEARAILNDMDIFALDPLTAVDRNAARHPSRAFRDFFGGYVSAIRSGGDVIHFLETKTEELFKARSSVLKVLSDRVSMYMETYITISVLMTLGFYTLFSVESIYSTGFFTPTMFILFAFGLIPLISIFIVVAVQAMQPKTPVRIFEPYTMSLIATPFALASSFISYMLIKLSPATSMTIGLLLISLPPAIIGFQLTRVSKGLETYTASFLRDLAEVRKTGLAPEKCIIQVSKRDHGPLSKHLKTLASQLSWGISLRRVYKYFTSRVRNWFALVNMYLLVEAIDVGGGAPSTIDSLATFSRISCDIEREQIMSMRPYILMPYIGAILLVLSTLMTLMLTATTMSFVPSKALQMSTLIPLFSTSVVFHCWMMGMVGGKISEGNLASGFRHGTILVLLAYLASYYVITSMGYAP